MHVRYHSFLLRVGFCVLALAIVSVGHAATVSRSEFQAFMDLSTGSTSHTVGMGTNGTPVVTRGAPGPTQVGNMNFAHDAGGLPYAKGQFDLPSPLAGKAVPLNGKVPLTAAQAAGAIGRFLGKVYTPLVVGMAVYDLAKDLGFDVGGQNADGGVAVTRGDSTVCTVAPCYNYWISNNSNPQVWEGSTAAACADFVSNMNVLVPGAAPWIMTGIGGSGPTSWHCLVTTEPSQKPGSWSFNYQSKAVSAPVYLASSIEELVSAIASESGWPSGNTDIDRALADAVNAGVPIDVSSPVQVSSAGVATVTDQNVIPNADGSTTQEDYTCSWVADLSGIVNWECGKTVTTTTPAKTTTETVTTTNPDGTTSTSTITRTTPSTTTVGTGTVAPTSGDPCASGAQTLGCAQFGTPVDGDPIGHKSVPFTITPVSFAGGSCPAGVAFTALGHSYTFDYTEMCTRLASMAPLFMVLASFIAAWIVADGFRVS